LSILPTLVFAKRSTNWNLGDAVFRDDASDSERLQVCLDIGFEKAIGAIGVLDDKRRGLSPHF